MESETKFSPAPPSEFSFPLELEGGNVDSTVAAVPPSSISVTISRSV